MHFRAEPLNSDTLLIRGYKDHGARHCMIAVVHRGTVKGWLSRENLSLGDLRAFLRFLRKCKARDFEVLRSDWERFYSKLDTVFVRIR